VGQTKALKIHMNGSRTRRFKIASPIYLLPARSCDFINICPACNVVVVVPRSY